MYELHLIPDDYGYKLANPNHLTRLPRWLFCDLIKFLKHNLPSRFKEELFKTQHGYVFVGDTDILTKLINDFEMAHIKVIIDEPRKHSDTIYLIC